MTAKTSISAVEAEKTNQMKTLLSAWKKQISQKPKIIFPDDGIAYSPKKYFAYDGFFPNYFAQKKKILFVGRETRLIGSDDFRKTSILHFKNNNVNQNIFWRRVLYILYGIQNSGKQAFSDIPTADEIAKEMISTNNFGFAVMNISKYSNDSVKTNANVELMNRFLKDSELEKRNFFQEELELLNPDIIITANLWKAGIEEQYIEQCFPSKNFSEELVSSQKANYWKYDLAGKSVDLINLYHFSALKKDEDFYNPVMNILFAKK